MENLTGKNFFPWSDERSKKSLRWNGGLETKGLRANIKKTKIMVINCKTRNFQKEFSGAILR